MNTSYPIAAVGELIGEPARAAILIALLDGKARAAGELALTTQYFRAVRRRLSKLVGGGLLTVHHTGHHGYYAMAGAEVAHALEALGSISSFPRARTARPRPLAADEMYAARSCYDHLAGRIAVDLAQALEKSNVIRACGEVTTTSDTPAALGSPILASMSTACAAPRRAFARQCLDWTERRPHLAGALGAALCSRFLALGWIARRRGTRALRITYHGARELHSRLGLTA